MGSLQQGRMSGPCQLILKELSISEGHGTAAQGNYVSAE